MRAGTSDRGAGLQVLYTPARQTATVVVCPSWCRSVFCLPACRAVHPSSAMARLRAATTTTAKGKTAASCAGALQHRRRAAGPPRSTSRSAVRVAPAADGGGSPLHGGRIRQIPAAGGIWERSTLAWCGLRRDWRAVWRGGEARPVRSLTLLSSRRHGKRHAGGRGQPRLKLGTHRGCLDGPVDSVGYDGSGAGSVPRRLVNSRRCGWRCRSGPACGGLDRIE